MKYEHTGAALALIQPHSSRRRRDEKLKRMHTPELNYLHNSAQPSVFKNYSLQIEPRAVLVLSRGVASQAARHSLKTDRAVAMIMKNASSHLQDNSHACAAGSISVAFFCSLSPQPASTLAWRGGQRSILSERCVCVRVSGGGEIKNKNNNCRAARANKAQFCDVFVLLDVAEQIRGSERPVAVCE